MSRKLFPVCKTTFLETAVYHVNINFLCKSLDISCYLVKFGYHSIRLFAQIIVCVTAEVHVVSVIKKKKGYLRSWHENNITKVISLLIKTMQHVFGIFSYEKLIPQEVHAAMSTFCFFAKQFNLFFLQFVIKKVSKLHFGE